MIFGLIKDDDNGEYRRRKNVELETLYQEQNIIETIKKRSLQELATFVEAMLLGQNPMGQRPFGKPRMKWEYMLLEKMWSFWKEDWTSSRYR